MHVRISASQLFRTSYGCRNLNYMKVLNSKTGYAARDIYEDRFAEQIWKIICSELFRSGAKASLNWAILPLHTISTALLTLFDKLAWRKIYANCDIQAALRGETGDLTSLTARTNQDHPIFSSS